MPSVSRIFSRNQYAPVIFWETSTLSRGRRLARADLKNEPDEPAGQSPFGAAEYATHHRKPKTFTVRNEAARAEIRGSRIGQQAPIGRTTETAAPGAKNQRLAFLPRHAYGRGVKTTLVCLVTTAVIAILGACASGKRKSSVHMYEGDSSPNIRMYEEKPGYPLNKF